MISTLRTYERQLRRQKNVDDEVDIGEEVGVGDGRESIGEFYGIFDVQGVGKVRESKGEFYGVFELYEMVGEQVDRGIGGDEVAQNLTKAYPTNLAKRNSAASNTN